MLADALRDRPDGLDDALALVDGLDDVLVEGLARISDAGAAALSALAAAVAGSPLASPAAEAIGKIIAGTVTDEHLAVLAGVRAALLGAAHDALLTGVDAAIGRSREPWSASPAAPAEGRLLSGARSWLRELAIAGWRGVDHDLAAGGAQAIQALLADPSARRLAVLLDGFAAELRASGVLLSHDGFASFDAVPVHGRLLILGADLHEHPTVFQAKVHGLLETADGRVRLVRAAVAAPKVDTISGPSVWRLLAAFPIFRAVLAERRAAELSGMLLTPAGDLLWDESAAAAGEPADPFAIARVRLGAAGGLPSSPLDRHPAAIAEPVLIDGSVDLGDGVTVDVDRLPAAGPLTPALVAASTACIGLLRWDAGRWVVQPLAVQAVVRKKPVAVHAGDWALGPTEAKAAKAEAAAGAAVDILRERAGRLLRK
jgi:hypothetical protein